MTSLMPTGAVQSFTGTNGTTINSTDFAIPINQGSGGSAQIQSNACRVRTGTSSGNRISIRLNRATTADMEVDFIWTVPTSGAQGASLFLRTVTAVDTQQGYEFTLSDTSMSLAVWTSYAGGGAIATHSHGFTAGQVVHSRFAIFGTRIRARTWLQSGSEVTSTWNIDVTNSTYTTGFAGVTVNSFSAGSKDLIIDEFNCTDTVTPSQQTINPSGSITASGTLTKTTAKTFAGSITASGALAKVRVVVRNFAGSITASGVLAKKTVKAYAGSITPSGALAKRVNKAFAGSITVSGVFAKKFPKKFAGSITPVGGLTITFLGKLFAFPGIVVTTITKAGGLRARFRRG